MDERAETSVSSSWYAVLDSFSASIHYMWNTDIVDRVDVEPSSPLLFLLRRTR